MSDVLVVGAGVSGLTCAVVLSRLGHNVTVVADKPPLNTTSVVATAVWHLYLVDPNDRLILDLGRETMRELVALADDPETGVSLTRGIELFRNSPRSEIAWSDIALDYAELSADEVAAYPGVRWGYRLLTPLAVMDRYLSWLARTVSAQGGRFEIRHLASLPTVAYDVVVNCAGLGARELVGDSSLVSVRGQYLVLEPSVAVPRFYIGDDENPEDVTYVIPRPNDVLVGGTEEHAVEDEDFEYDAEAMLRRAAGVAPWLARRQDFIVQKQVVGLRPMRRDGVRLEMVRETPDTAPVIHNYGHGGSGFSLSWGCANRVAHFVASLT